MIRTEIIRCQSEAIEIDEGNGRVLLSFDLPADWNVRVEPVAMLGKLNADPSEIVTDQRTNS